MGKRKLIGVFATEVSSRVQVKLYKELYEKARISGYNLVLFSATYDSIDARKTSLISYNLFEIAQNMDFAAIIIHAQSIDNSELIDYVVKMGKARNIPVFLYDCETIGIYKSKGVITINPDYKSGFADVVKHLIEHHNCKKIYMLAGFKDNKYSDDRIEVYKQQMEAHGLPVNDGMIEYGDFWEFPATKALNKMLDSDLPVPEAICCANDSMAITAVKVLAERGLSVPGDVLVTGFDGIEDGKYYIPSISTCEPKLDEVAKFIFDVIEGVNTADEYMIPLQFLAKESCCGKHLDSENDRNELSRLIGCIRQNTWQNHMLAAMQVSLMDCSDITESTEYMLGTLDFFRKYDHLFCLRDDLEYLSDYSTPFKKMRVHLNSGFLPEDNYDAYDIKEVLPKYDEVFINLQPEDIFFAKLIHSAEKMYGYYVVKSCELISNEMKLLGQFSENFTNIIEAVLRNRRLIIANQKLSDMYERMSEIYIRDTLTGLYNRNGYYQQLEELKDRENIKDGYLHIISIDMDDMKYINDNYGHQEGDIAIKAVANTIDECFSQPCICARFGGDEFMVALFTDEREKPTEDKIAVKLNSYLSTIPMLEGKKYSVGVSVGTAVAKIADISELNFVEKMADDSMYRNKRKRKAQIRDN